MPFVELPPKRTVAIGGTLGDVEGMLEEGHGYFDRDGVTRIHEIVHAINARGRNENAVAIAIYFLKGKAFTIRKHPRFKLKDVANEIPQEKRGRLFDLYLRKQQRWWNNEPGYIADELSAYTHGARGGFELGMTSRGEESRDNAIEMWRYTRVFQRMAKAAAFEYQADLDECLDFFHAEHLSPLLKA